jgi:hypothetical protein
MIVGGLISTGGITALIVKFRARKAASKIPAEIISKEK